MERVKGAAVTTDQNCEIPTRDVEDELPLVPIVLIDGHLVLTKEPEDITHIRDGGVRNLVNLSIAQALGTLKVLADLRKLILWRLLGVFHLLRSERELVLHDAPPLRPSGVLSPSSWGAACARDGAR